MRSLAQAQAGGLEVVMGSRLLPLVHLGFRQVLALCPLPARLASGVLGDTPGFTVGSGFLSNFSSITDTHFVAQLLKDRVASPSTPVAHRLVLPMVLGAPDTGEDKKVKSLDQSAIAPPYDHYTITQGPHGFSYGHMAIDITAGQGAKIKSPINGVITDLYIDQYGNPTLVIESKKYTITLLHGIYKVEPGDKVKLGHVVGYESNLGYTIDMAGRSCLGRDCGYHTHINIFDKHLGVNLNPLEVFSK